MARRSGNAPRNRLAVAMASTGQRTQAESIGGRPAARYGEFSDVFIVSNPSLKFVDTMHDLPDLIVTGALQKCKVAGCCSRLAPREGWA